MDKKSTSVPVHNPSECGISIKDALTALADLALPRTCIVCGRQLLMRERHICIYCMSDLPLTHFWTLSHNPMADMFNEKIQETSHIRPGERYAYAAALFYYQSEAGYKKITQQLKYHSNLSAGRYFAKMLGHELANSTQFKDVDCVIPVPLHWTRRWKRGYNQSEVIASELAVGLKAALETRIIYRARHTRTQTKLSMEEKSTNVCSAFRVRKCALRPLTSFRHILLVDDVFTTGATLTACYRTLREGIPSTFRISIATLGFVGR